MKESKKGQFAVAALFGMIEEAEEAKNDEVITLGEFKNIRNECYDAIFILQEHYEFEGFVEKYKEDLEQ